MLFTPKDFNYVKLMALKFICLAWTAHLQFKIVYSPRLEYLVSIANEQVQSQTLNFSFSPTCFPPNLPHLRMWQSRSSGTHVKIPPTLDSFLSVTSHPHYHGILSFLLSERSTVKVLLTFNHLFSHGSHFIS